MKYLLLLVGLILSQHFVTAQTLTAEQVLDKSIQYHDPKGKWEKFKGNLRVEAEFAERPSRVTDISINLRKDKFSAVMRRENHTTTIKLKGDNCSVDVKDTRPDENKDPNERKMDCERARLYKDYYTYLYGLPMKLNDPGTNLDQTVEKREFQGKEYLVLKATYDQEVGNDVWYFYFDPATYAMEIYQFYKTDDNGKVKENSGEYILLSGIKNISGIKMPKTRAWYYNDGDRYLATDVLVD